MFLRQFKSPLIYVLLAGAVVSLLLRDWSDAGFILAVLLVNAAIGTYQEYSAERSAEALRSQALNSRSETLSVFRHDPLRNKLLLFGTLAAQLVHIGAMYTPGLSAVLGVRPVRFDLWLELLGLALVLLLAVEAHKWLRRRFP